MKVGVKTKKIDAKVIEFEHLGVKREALLIMPYGMMANAPDDGLIIASCQDGNTDSWLCYPTDAENIDELENNEVAFGIPSKDTRIKFKADGKINIRVGEADSTDYAVRYNELKKQLDQLKSDYQAHTHTFSVILAPSGTYNGTTAAGASTSADFTNCKVSKINLPAVAED